MMPFGAVIGEMMGQFDQAHAFTWTVIPGTSSGPRAKGMWYDAGSVGLYKTQTRSYAPGIGRFTQVDPARAGNNWYAYCGGDPVNHIDPSGLAFYAFDHFARFSTK